MPVYGYRCEKCGHEFEVLQKVSDPPASACTECEAKVHRIYYPVGVIFKGSGFYVTDSRAQKAASAKKQTDAAKPADSGSSATADAGAASPESPAKSTESAGGAEPKAASE
ncbi:MAG: FmdB family zinc ribbon protein [Candidatus Dormibacteria bacterium]